MKYCELFTLGTHTTEPYIDPNKPSLQPIILCFQISSNSLIASTILCSESNLVFLLHRRLLFACYIPRPFYFIFLYFMTLRISGEEYKLVTWLKLLPTVSHLDKSKNVKKILNALELYLKHRIKLVLFAGSTALLLLQLKSQ
jgi:hypothetical protein